MTLRAADNLYVCSAHCSVTYCPVTHSGVKRLYDAISRLARNLDDVVADDFWRDLMRRLKRYRFTLCTVPVAVNWRSNEVKAYLVDRLSWCQRVYPQYVPLVGDILNAVDDLTDLDDNPLLAAIESSLDTILTEGEPGTMALLIARPGLLPLAEVALSKCLRLGELALVNQFQLRKATTYDVLIVIGSVRLFPEYVFSAPRGKAIHLIDFSWLLDRWHHRPVLSSSVTGKGRLDEPPTAGNPPVPEPPIDELLPPVDWETITKTTTPQRDEDEEQEEVAGRLYLLAGEMAVFLENLPDSTVLVLDIDEEEEGDEEDLLRVHRMPTAELRPGIFLLLRTEGAGDYVVPIADRLLGRRAQELRAMQDNWKQRLRRAVRADGIASVREQLRRFGSIRANTANIRNWMSTRNIRPEDKVDFQAIMRLIGLESEVDRYWQAADQIDTAHRKAGFRIRQLLLKQVEHIDLTRLHIDGYVDIELPGAEGGSLTAFRIEYIAPSTQLVATQRLGHPFKLEDDIWPA